GPAGFDSATGERIALWRQKTRDGRDCRAEISRGNSAMRRDAVSAEVLSRLTAASAHLQDRIDKAGVRVEDADTDDEVRRWLDGTGPALEWAGTAVTTDEWFFITTLYGTMT